MMTDDNFNKLFDEMTKKLYHAKDKNVEIMANSIGDTINRVVYSCNNNNYFDALILLPYAKAAIELFEILINELNNRQDKRENK